MTGIRGAMIAESGNVKFIDVAPSLDGLAEAFGTLSVDFRYGPGWVAVERANIGNCGPNAVALSVFRRFRSSGVVEFEARGPALILGYSADAPGIPDFPGVCDLPLAVASFLAGAVLRSSGA